MKQIIALASLALLPFSQVAAEGFQVNAQSTKQAGMGHVGAALKLGAESMHFNPAGLVYMNNAVELSAGVSGVFAYAKCQTGNETYMPVFIALIIAAGAGCTATVVASRKRRG